MSAMRKGDDGKKISSEKRRNDLGVDPDIGRNVLMPLSSYLRDSLIAGLDKAVISNCYPK